MKKREYYFSVLKKNRMLIIAAAAVLMIIAAAVFFFVYKNSQSITIEEAEASTDNKTAEQTDNKVRAVFVDIGGCVRKPGVYEVPESSRVFEVIEKAGGLSEDADVSAVNQAEPVTDGQKIFIPDKESAGEASLSLNHKDDQGRININTADSSSLEEIPGVGPVTAEKIISYREQNGRFGKIEDIKNVSGIGEKTYEKMKDHIIC